MKILKSQLEKKFTPYSIVIQVETVEDHKALKNMLIDREYFLNKFFIKEHNLAKVLLNTIENK